MPKPRGPKPVDGWGVWRSFANRRVGWDFDFAFPAHATKMPPDELDRMLKWHADRRAEEVRLLGYSARAVRVVVSPATGKARKHGK